MYFTYNLKAHASIVSNARKPTLLRNNSDGIDFFFFGVSLISLSFLVLLSPFPFSLRCLDHAPQLPSSLLTR